MLTFLEENLLTRVKNAVAAGTSNQTTTHVDMQGYESVTFVALFGALTAGQATTLQLQEGNDSADADMADVSGVVTTSMLDTDSNKMVVLSRYFPTKRYCRLTVVRTLANSVLDGVLAIQHLPTKHPVTQGSTVSQSKISTL